MLAFDFDYYRPDTIAEATDIYSSVKAEGKTPLYYGGGTEIISMSRVFSIKPDAVIDLKRIPECCGFGTDGSVISFGSAVMLSAIAESGLYPLLGLAAGRIADHTMQCKITLGGNLGGTIRYHETLPPLLLAGGVIDIAGPAGTRSAPIADVLNFNKRLAPEEFIVRVSLDRRFASLPYIHVKKSRIEKIGYPLVTLSAIYTEGIMSAAVSGACDYPFRFGDINIKGKHSAAELAQQFTESIPGPVLDDIGGSAGYRSFILNKTIENAIIALRES